MRFTILFAFFLCFGIYKAHCLQCYVCENCNDVKDQPLQSCPLEVTTTERPTTVTPATRPPIITNNPPEITSGAPEKPTTPPIITTSRPEITTEAPEKPTTPPTITTSPPEITTGAPEKPTTPPIITTSPTEITTGAPEKPTTSPIIITNPPQITTRAPEITTKAPETTTGAPETTTGAPETTTGAPETTSRAPEITTGALDITTNAPVTNNTELSELENIREKRHIARAKPLIDNNGCHCSFDEDNCDCSNKLNQIADEVSVIEFVCFKASITIDNTTAVIVRGCTPSQMEGKPICEYASSSNTEVTACTTCNTDGCNAAINIRESMFIIIISIAALWYK